MFKNKDNYAFGSTMVFLFFNNKLINCPEARSYCQLDL